MAYEQPLKLKKFIMDTIVELNKMINLLENEQNRDGELIATYKRWRDCIYEINNICLERNKY